ncbi:MAG: hypothetical protein JSV12_04085 [Candidatus Bathyarchaeota archaeon]|nr:MAG: hypothetical protein JSV12_04085 [Candidatus Bathyarchaeota archaeon]
MKKPLLARGGKVGGRKKKEITVPAPPRPSRRPAERARKAQAEAIEKERLGTLKVAQKVGRVFSGLTVVTGVLLLLFSVYLTITGPLTSSPEMKLFFIVMLAFLSVVNMVSGLLLMGRD